jgi:hypothetical protein
MRFHTCFSLLAVAAIVCQSSAFADDNMRPRDGQRWWYGETGRGFWGGPCEVKTESKPGEYKRDIKCKDGVGASWRGEWKSEFRDGPCLIKQEAKREEFKEEIKCERRR